VLADQDRKTLVLFGGDEVCYEAPLQRVFMQMLAPLWSGWRLEWAHRGLADLADYASARSERPQRLPRRRRRFDTFASEPIVLAEEDACLGDCWISLRSERGAIADYLLDTRGHGPSALKPGLLSQLEAARPRPVPMETDVTCGALIDCAWRTILVWDGAPTANLVSTLKRSWPAWSVKRQLSGWRRQVRETGRKTAGRAANRQVLMRRIEAIVSNRAPHGAHIAQALSRLKLAEAPLL
jgi:hypothetical protein